MGSRRDRRRRRRQKSERQRRQQPSRSLGRIFAGGFAANVLTGALSDVLGTSATEVAKRVIILAAGLGIVAVAVVGGATLLPDDEQFAAAPPPTLAEPPLTMNEPPSPPPPPPPPPPPQPTTPNLDELAAVATALSAAFAADPVFAERYCQELRGLSPGQRPLGEEVLPEYPEELAGTEAGTVLAGGLAAARADPAYAAAVHKAAC